MNRLIIASLRNPHAVVVLVLSMALMGVLAGLAIPVDILPVFRSPAVQVLTFYGGMPAGTVEKDITNRMERWVGQAAGTRRQESRSIVGASIVRNYFQADVDPGAALTQVNSLALATVPNLPPGTLPPVVLPFDPTSSTPVCLVALDSPDQTESVLYDVGRYEVRNMVMGINGAVAPVVYGGKVRAVMVYLDRQRLQARNLSPLDVMRAVDDANLFLPTGGAKFGDTDYAIDSNSMYQLVDRMGEIPLRIEPGNATYLRDVATPTDANFIQTNVVRVDGRRQVYIPVYRQLGASTLGVVDGLRASIGRMKDRLTRPGIDLAVVMDQSVYVRHAIEGLAEEAVLGAVLCSMVILLFLGQWRMTAIAVLTIPIAVAASIACLHLAGQTINVMTLAGLALAIGPMVDSAIICLENTHRHLGMGSSPERAAYFGASEVALPELVASLCTLLVLAPLALMPGLGEFLFRPMALAVAFAMVAAYGLSRTFVPVCCAAWLEPHAHGHDDAPKGPLGRAFARWDAAVEGAVGWYARRLERVMRFRWLAVGASLAALVGTLGLLGPDLRREFFPEVDAGAFEMSVRTRSGTRIEVTEQKVEAVETFVRDTLGDDLEMLISEIGVTSDWSAAYTPNAGPMDAVLKVQLAHHRHRSAQEWAHALRTGLAGDPRFADLEVAFDAGGIIRGALNEGRSAPITVRVSDRDPARARRVAERLRRRAAEIDGVVDARVIQRLDYPQYVIDVDRAKAADLGLTQADVMKNVVAALNSSIQFNKKNFWIDPVSHNQYFVGVSYPEEEITSVQTLLDIPITGPAQDRPVPLRNFVSLRRTTVPTEVTHAGLRPTIDLTMGVHGRDLGHVADDLARAIDAAGERQPDGSWVPFDPDSGEGRPIRGAQVVLGGEYARMRETFGFLTWGLALASLLIYFLMVALFRSFVVPLVILFAVPIGLVGVVLMLAATGTAVNVQSLLGVIFMVGIVVANTVLLVDFAQQLRRERGLAPAEAIRAAASVRARPVVMTALAALLALTPMALAWQRGTEANAPLGRAVIGGLLAGLVTTLFVVPSLYALLVRDDPSGPDTAADLDFDLA